MTLYVLFRNIKPYLSCYPDDAREMATRALAASSCKPCRRKHKLGQETPRCCRIEQSNVAPAAVLIDYRCSECEWSSVSTGGDEPGPRYECGDCGTEFARQDSADGDSNRCPDCHRFSAKIADLVCPECGGEVVTEHVAPS